MDCNAVEIFNSQLTRTVFPAYCRDYVRLKAAGEVISDRVVEYGVLGVRI